MTQYECAQWYINNSVEYKTTGRWKLSSEYLGVSKNHFKLEMGKLFLNLCSRVSHGSMTDCIQQLGIINMRII
jgi:hypothetical protein